MLEDGEPVRLNFNSFTNSLITIFVLLTGENWNAVMSIYVFYYGFGSCLYFVSLIIIGNIMLLNLFLAILLNYISATLEDEDEEEEGGS